MSRIFYKYKHKNKGKIYHKIKKIYIKKINLNTVEYFSDTEFARAINGVSAAPVWEIMNELMTVLQAIKPGLYEGVLRKLRDTP